MVLVGIAGTSSADVATIARRFDQEVLNSIGHINMHILLVALDKHDRAESARIWDSDLVRALKQSKCCRAVQARSVSETIRHLQHPGQPPQAVVLVDDGASQYKNAKVLPVLQKYVEIGGTVIIANCCSSGFSWQGRGPIWGAFGLKWRIARVHPCTRTYHRTVTTTPSITTMRHRNFGPAVCIRNVDFDQALLAYQPRLDKARCDQHGCKVTFDIDEHCAAVLYPLRQGRVGYVGSASMFTVVLQMCLPQPPHPTMKRWIGLSKAQPTIGEGNEA